MQESRHKYIQERLSKLFYFKKGRREEATSAQYVPTFEVYSKANKRGTGTR